MRSRSRNSKRPSRLHHVNAQHRQGEREAELRRQEVAVQQQNEARSIRKRMLTVMLLSRLLPLT